MQGFLTDEQRFGIVEDILHTEMSFKQIAAKWQTSYTSVVQINRNEAYWIRYKYGESLPKPLRKTPQDFYKEMEELFRAGKTVEEIANTMNVGIDAVLARKDKYQKKVLKKF